jgi:hypothetical protein
MGASRENLNLFIMLKNGGYKRLNKIIRQLIKSKWYRRNLYEDTIVRPFNKKIGCRLFGHNWATKHEIEYYGIRSEYCWKCNKRVTISEKREMIIDEILK